jgi:hypothetical protein
MGSTAERIFGVQTSTTKNAGVRASMPLQTSSNTFNAFGGSYGFKPTISNGALGSTKPPSQGNVIMGYTTTGGATKTPTVANGRVIHLSFTFNDVYRDIEKRKMRTAAEEISDILIYIETNLETPRLFPEKKLGATIFN